MATPNNQVDALSEAFAQQIHRLSPAPRRWLIAHSGGLDSQVLLHLAAQHLPAAKVQVIHINHQLQAAANQWAQFSAEAAQQLGFTHHTLSLELADHSENSARQGRYRVFAELLQPGDCLLMGHHADDQAETLLFRLLRGSGLAGLAAMPRERPLAAGRLLRPLLQQTRQTLEVWAAEQSLQWVDDPTNQHDIYDRNYLRHRIMPVLQQRWPGFVGRWGRTARLLSEAHQLLNEYLDDDLQRVQGDAGQLLCERLPDDPLKRQALLYRWLQHKNVELSSRQLQRIQHEVIEAREDAQPRLQLGNFEVRRYRSQLYCLVLDTVAQPPASLPDVLSLGVSVLDSGELHITSGPGLKVLQGVQLVYRQGGESLHPAGRQGRCSLKKYLQEQGVPPWQRAQWPLLVKAGEIVAVPGLCICEGWQTESDGFQLRWLPF